MIFFEEKISQKIYSEPLYYGSGGIPRKCVIDKKFGKSVAKMDSTISNRVYKNMVKIMENPECGKYLVANRKGLQETKIDSFRLYYSFSIQENLVRFIEFSHKDNQ